MEGKAVFLFSSRKKKLVFFFRCISGFSPFSDFLLVFGVECFAEW